MKVNVSRHHGSIEISASPSDILSFAGKMVERIVGEPIEVRLDVTDYGPAEGTGFSFEVDHPLRDEHFVSLYAPEGEADIYEMMENDQELFERVYRPLRTLTDALRVFFPTAEVDYDEDCHSGETTFITFTLNPEQETYDGKDESVIRRTPSEDHQSAYYTREVQK